jgi:hypothetical protein
MRYAKPAIPKHAPLVAILAAWLTLCLSCFPVRTMSGQAGGAMQAAANQVAMNAEEPLDGSAAPATLESQALESEVIPATVTYLAREYVWGNGDWGVDELLAQYDADRRASWPLQDAGGDVIALCDRGGANGTARVITQIVYDAHGSVIDRDDPYGLAASAGKELRVGHKGLFFDRLDAGISDPVTGQETPRLWPGARLSGYARNRTLHCDFGRWNQPDPNATGLPVQAAFVFHGSGLRSRVQRFDLQGHYALGANPYGFLSGNPMTWADPLGLIEFNFASLLGSMTIRGTVTTAVSGAVIGGLFGGITSEDRSVGGIIKSTFIGAGVGAVSGVAAYWTGGLGIFGTGVANMVLGSTVGGAVGGTMQGLIDGHRGKQLLFDAMFGGSVGFGMGLLGGVIASKAEALLPMEKQLLGDLFSDVFGEAWDIAGGISGGAAGSGVNYLRRAWEGM